MRVALAGARFQLLLFRRSPADFMALVTAPLMTVSFLAVVEHSGRPDLYGHAVLAPGLMALWGMSLLVAGDMIDVERGSGTLQALVAVPASTWPLLVGRIVVVAGVSALGMVESWLVAWLGFGVVVPIRAPGVFALTLLLTVLVMSAWASVMTSLFVLSRSARTFQNSLSFPFYVLGGVLVPVALLPGFLHGPADLVFLHWSADLLRDSLRGPVPDVGARVAALAALGVVGGVIGKVLLSWVLRRVRHTGSISFE